MDTYAYACAIALRTDAVQLGHRQATFSIESLPAFRRPAMFGGTGKDALWQIEDSKITGELEAVQDSATHVSILPRATMLLEKYEAALASTRNDWERV